VVVLVYIPTNSVRGLGVRLKTKLYIRKRKFDHHQTFFLEETGVAYLRYQKKEIVVWA
jgi:hypothetical protein